MRVRNSRKRLCFESLEKRRLLAAKVMEFEGVGYFFSDTAPTVQRYDLAAEQWLSPVSLSGASTAPSAAHVDGDGLYAAFDRAVYRYALDGSSSQHVVNTTENVINLHSDGNLLLINHSSGSYTRATSVSKSTNTVLDTINDYLDTIYGSSIAPEANRIFGRTRGSSPSDITYLSYSDGGEFLENRDSSYHGDYAGASRTWVFPDGRNVVDSSGTVYSTNSLTYAGRMGTGIIDIAFWKDNVPVILNEGAITAYSNAYLPTGTKAVSGSPSQVFTNENNALLFTANAGLTNGYSIEKISMDSLGAIDTGDIVDPVGLAYAPDDMAVLNDGTLMIFSRDHQSLFRWDPSETSYVESIRLVGAPSYFAYSETLDRIYTAYPDGLIRKIDLDDSTREEKAFLQLPAAPLGLVAAGALLVAEDGSGAWTTLTTINADGVVTDAKDWHYPSKGLVWDATSQSILYISTYSPNDLHVRPINVSTGAIGVDRDSTLHGSSLIQSPIRVSPDGSQILMGSGGFFSMNTIAPLTHALSNTVVDATWIDDGLFTVRNIAGVNQVQAWSDDTYGQTNIRQFSGDATRLIAVNEERLLLVAEDAQGRPTFRVLDGNLNDATVDLGEKPVIEWEPPEAMYGFESLSEAHLSAMASVPGTYVYSPPLGARLPVGEDQTLSLTFIPTDNVNYRTVTVAKSIDVLGVDFGDAPDSAGTGFAASYPTLLGDDGARHGVGGLFLGAQVDAEQNGQPSNDNAAGDNSEGADEDGVRLAVSMYALSQASSSSLVVNASAAGKLDAWIDFNQDGDWNDPGEQILASREITGGENLVSFPVAAGASAGMTGMRVRLSESGDLAPTGLAAAGEVEDYMVALSAPGDPLLLNVPGELGTSIDYAGETVVVHYGETQIAELPHSLWNVQRMEGTPEDDDLMVDPAMKGPVLLVGTGGEGEDSVILQAAGQIIDLTEAIVNEIRGLEILDIRGDGANSIFLDPAAIQRISQITGQLHLLYDNDDLVRLGEGWQVELPTIKEGGILHTLVHGGIRLTISNERPFQNPFDALDVDRSGSLSPSDALWVINHLSRQLEDAESLDGLTEAPDGYYDTTGDNTISPLDALFVINELARKLESGGEGEGTNDGVVLSPIPLPPVRSNGRKDWNSGLDSLAVLAKSEPKAVIGDSEQTDRIDQIHAIAIAEKDPLPLSREVVDDLAGSPDWEELSAIF